MVATQHAAFITTNHITMYFCSRSEKIEYSLEKIHIQMAELVKKIPEVGKQPATEEEDRIGDINLGHPVARLIVRYRVLKYWAENPPDPRGDKMCSRPAPYFIHVSTKELALAIGVSVRTVQRAMQTIHEEMKLNLRSQPTVNEFCEMCGYKQEDIDKIHQNLAHIREGKWKKIKDLHSRKDDDE
jgi:hypothetical protein